MSQHIEAQEYPFYAIIMAAMRKSDSQNEIKLKAMWPDVWRELERRYHYTGGYFPEERVQIAPPIEEMIDPTTPAL